MTTFDHEYRCPTDHKLLFKGVIVEGAIEIKCKHCKQTHRFEPVPLDSIICRKEHCAHRMTGV